MTRNAISTTSCRAIGPYSMGVETSGLVFLSGQTALDPATGELVDGGIAEQTAQCFKGLLAVLHAAGLSEREVVKVNVYLVDMKDFAAMNAIYEKYFTAPFPARTTIGVAALPKAGRIEIEVIARTGKCTR